MSCYPLQQYLGTHNPGDCTGCQHERDAIISEYNGRYFVNIRLQPPDDEFDDAYVIRVRNGTVIYTVSNTDLCTDGIPIDIIQLIVGTSTSPSISPSSISPSFCVTTTASTTPTSADPPNVQTDAKTAIVERNIAIGVLLPTCIVAIVIAIIFIFIFILIRIRVRNTRVSDSEEQRPKKEATSDSGG